MVFLSWPNYLSTVHVYFMYPCRLMHKTCSHTTNDMYHIPERLKNEAEMILMEKMTIQS